MKFSDKVIITDVDGTYTGSAEGVRKNNEAIEYFKANGGLFTFASGRVEYAVESVVPGFFGLINAPAVLANGSYLYDKESKTRINEICIDTSYALPFLKEFRAKFPEMGIRINRKTGFLTPELNPPAYNDLKAYFSNVQTLPFDGMPTDGWNKIVLIGTNEQVLAARDYVAENCPGRFAFTMSCRTLLELLAPEATKGNQIRYLKKMLGGRTVYCCGDYENDIDMLKKADVAVVPSSGMPEVVEMADIVACHCKDGVIAYLVDLFEREGGK